MDDLDLSSCSFLTEVDENQQEPQISQADYQNLVLQKDRLQEVNNQLQSSLDNLKAQLKEALEAVASTKGFSEQVQVLKGQLADANEKREKLQQDLKLAAENGENSNSKYLQEINTLRTERDALAEEIEVQNEQRNKLKQDKQALRAALEEKQVALENAIEDISKYKQQKKKLQQKQNISIAAMKEMQNKIDQLTVQVEKDQNEKTTQQQEIDELKLQIGDITQSNTDLKNEIQSIKGELEARNNANQALEAQFNAQREEMEAMTREKQKIITLLHKMSAAFSASEIKIESLQKENSLLMNKQAQKQTQRNASLMSRTDILDLKIPFEGELGDDCEKIMKLPQYQPIQRIQLILNESAKRLHETETEMKSIKDQHDSTVKQLEESNEESQKYIQILYALLKDLKELSLNEQNISKVADCNVDQHFINYVTEKCAQIDPTIREKVLSHPHFISSDFFFTDDVTKRKKEIQSIADQNDTTFAILTAQFIANTILHKQLDTLLAQKDVFPTPKVEEQEQPIADEQAQNSQSAASSANASGIAANHPELQEKLIKTTKYAKQLKQQIKKAQQTQMELQKADSEQKTKIAQLQIQNDDLKNELDVANMKLQVALNEAAKGENSISGIATQIKDSLENQKQQDISATLSELQRKNEECEQLNILLKKAQASFDQAIQTKTKQYKKQEEILKREIYSLTEQVDDLTQQIALKKKQQKKKDKINAQHQEAAIQELQANYEETKTSLNNTIETLKEKAQQAREMSQKLMTQIAECEQKNQQLSSENAQYIAGQKKIQVELASMKQQINKERQHLQGQLSAQMMAYEAKLQKTTKDANDQADKRVQDILDIAQNTLGVAYGLEDVDNEEVFKQLVSMVKSDLDKLHYFQSETTKFTIEKKN